MNQHSRISELLPLYVSGALERNQRLAVEQHLYGCAACQADLALWKATAGAIVTEDQEIAAPRGLAERALAQVRQVQSRPWSIAIGLGRIFRLIRSQMPLVQREIWPASAAVVGLGYIAALIAAQSGVIYALAPLVAAACISLIYGPENDPAYELALSTPTSPRQILLARLVIVFGYNLGLVLLATLALPPALRQSLLGELALAWLAPMTFLSAVALLLSLWVGGANAISITYLAWLGQLFAKLLRSPQIGVGVSPTASDFFAAYQGFWETPALLLALAALLLGLAVWLVGRQGNQLLHPA